MTAVKAVFLDMGGTVLEVHGVAEPYRSILSQHGYSVTIEQVRAWLAEARQPGLDSTRGERGGDFRLDPAAAAGRHRARVDAFLDLAGIGNGRNECRAAMFDSWVGTDVFGLYPEARTVLASLKQAGMIIGAVSNWEPRLPELCARLGVSAYFDFILASEAEGYSKPGTRLFQFALERAGVQPAEAIHAGDHLVEDVHAAESLGIRAVLIDRSGHRAGHSPAVPSLTELLPLAFSNGWLQGQIVAGNGAAAGFLRLDWLIEEVRSKLGFAPYPGTLNLQLTQAAAMNQWAELRAAPGTAIEPAPGFCAARCFPVSIEGRLPGAILLPEIPGYPEDVIEVIAPASVRETLSIAEGAAITLALV